jgi:hypothetical protein
MDATRIRSSSRPAAPGGWSGRRLLPAAGFVLYGLVLWHFMGGYAGGSDSSGYLNNARLLSAGRCTAAIRLVPGLAPATLPPYTGVPLGFIPNPDHVTMTPTYPMGLSIMFAGTAAVAGWPAAPAIVLILHALAGLWLVYLLGRHAGLEAGWSWLAALLLAASPVYVMMALQPMSDVPALVWVTAAVLAAWRSRERAWLAPVAGFAFALGVLVRPTDVLALVPLAVVLGRSRRRWSRFAIGCLPGAAFQGAFNLAAYGHLFTTGYGYVSPEFGWANVIPALGMYLRYLPVLLTPLGLLALGLPWLGRDSPRLAIVLTVWALVFPLFYLFYASTHDIWGNLRFLLPAFPALLVGALLVARRLAARCGLAPRAAWLAPAAAAILLHGAAWSRHLHAYTVGRAESVYPLTAAWLQAHLPPDAVVAAMQVSGALYYYTPFTFIRWDMLSAGEFQRIAAVCAADGRPVYAVLFPFEIGVPAWDAFGKHLPGHWTEVGTVRQVRIWRLDAARAAP